MSVSMTIDKFSRAFHAIRDMGFVRSLRGGPTGIGHTLQELLKLPEDNIALPDLGIAELKAHRISSSSMITLFTFNRKAWKIDPLRAIRSYGIKDKNGRLGLYFTMSLQPNSKGLFLYTTHDAVSVRHISGVIIAEWKLKDLTEQFRTKFPALIFVSAFSEMRGDREWFHYDRARLLTGVSEETMLNQIQSGNIMVDLRLHDKGTAARNHGTGFRTFEDRLPQLFSNVRDI